MKVKAIAQKFIEQTLDVNDTEKVKESIQWLVNQFWADFVEVKKNRNIKTDHGLIPLFKEMDKKWNALSKRLTNYYGGPIIKPNGFRAILKHRSPFSHDYYINNL